MVRRLSLASLDSGAESPVYGEEPSRGKVRTGAPRLAATYDMSVIDRHSGRWYVKDIRASTQPMGTQWLGSRHRWSRVAPTWPKVPAGRR